MQAYTTNNSYIGNYNKLFTFADQCRQGFESSEQNTSPLTKLIGLTVKSWAQLKLVKLISNNFIFLEKKTNFTFTNLPNKNNSNIFFQRITAIFLIVIGAGFLSDAMGKNSAKLKEAEDVWLDIQKFTVENPIRSDAERLITKVKQNTINLRLIPNIGMLVGCAFALVGSLYTSREATKGGILLGLGSSVVQLFLNSYYAKENREIYELSKRVCDSINPVSPSAPEWSESENQRGQNDSTILFEASEQFNNFRRVATVFTGILTNKWCTANQEWVDQLYNNASV